jgi:methylated-DNA-protein-cysteine methyltransferase-like protein
VRLAPTAFELAVAKVVKAIPRGQVRSYGEVAARAGRPGAARAVVRVLHRAVDIPWWRVVRSNRTLAPQVAVHQRERLAREGVRVVGLKIITRTERRGAKQIL